MVNHFYNCLILRLFLITISFKKIYFSSENYVGKTIVNPFANNYQQFSGKLSLKCLESLRKFSIQFSFLFKFSIGVYFTYNKCSKFNILWTYV